MLILAFDCCLGDCSAALVNQGSLVAVRRGDDDATPAETLVPLIRDLLTEQQVGWRDIGALAVTVGPGSFTGIRAGLSAARGFALATGLKIFPIGSLEAIVYSSLSSSDPRSILVINDARRGEMFVQRFDSLGVELTTVERCAAVEISDEHIATHRLVGSGVALLKAGIAEPDSPGFAGIDARFVGAAAQARALRGHAPLVGKSVAPLYLRRPDARPNAGRPLVTIVT